MKRLTSYIIAAMTVVLLVAAVIFSEPGDVEAQGRSDTGVVRKTTVEVYAVKFLCGELPPGDAADRREGPVKPGNYQTAINIHNANPATVNFRKKAVLLFDSDNPPAFEPMQPMPPGERFPAHLEPDWGMKIDCPDIRSVFLAPRGTIAPTGFIKGWVVIEVPGNLNKDKIVGTAPLDVVAVYTAHSFGPVDAEGRSSPEGFSIDVETVASKLFSNAPLIP